MVRCVFWVWVGGVGFSVGQLQLSIAQTPAEQTRRPELPFLQPRTAVSRAPCSLPSFLSEDLPSDLNTVVFCLRAGSVPFITSPSSANTSAWKQKWVRATHSRVLHGQRRANPWEDDIAGLRHRSFPAVDIHHRLLHQRVVELPPGWPAGSYSCSAGWRNPLLSHTHQYSEKCYLTIKRPDTWAPGFTHAPNSTGSVLLVTVTMTSAPLTASSAELKAFTGPGTEWQNTSTRCLVRLHTRTCSDGNKQAGA